MIGADGAGVLPVILALETSTPSAGVALLRGEEVLAQEEAVVPRRHLEWLAPAIRRLLDDQALPPDGVQAVAVSTGPGGFTSVRIGLATALAWARARHVPLVGVPTLAVVAAGVGDSGPVCVLLDVRQGAVAGALYDPPNAGRPRMDPVVGTVEEVLRRLPPDLAVTFVGDALERYEAAVRAAHPRARIAPRETWAPTAAALGRLAWRRLSRGERDHLYQVRPHYARPAVAGGEPASGGAVGLQDP